jgi:autotransporter-associated beta strand protein
MRITSVFSLVGIYCLTVGIGSAAPAPQLIWDPLNNGGTTAGNGNWDTTAGNAVWWNGASDVVWSQTSTTAGLNGATFNGPDAAPGTYAVSLDSSQIAVTNNLYINNNGYVFSGANAIYICTTNTLSVAAGKTVTFNCNMAGSGTSPYWVLGSGATVNVTGNLTASQQVRLAGAAGSAINLSGVINNPGIVFVLTQVNVTNGALTPSSSFYIGYPATINGTSYSSGALTVSGSSTVATFNGNVFIIGRSGGSGTLAVQDGTVNIGTSTTARNLAIVYDANANGNATVNVSGGVLNVGTAGQLASQIAFFDTGSSLASETGVLTQSGGTINAWGGIVIGLGGGVGSATLTQSGGILYVGANGITRGGSYTGPFSIALSGGTVGALATWSSSVPMTLGTAGGNTIFQCADNNGTPHNITLSGALTDKGGGAGLSVTGGGTLTLSGTNKYAGTTAVSNGTLAVVTGAFSMTSGPVLLDGSTGSPALAMQVTEPGEDWSVGALTVQNGSPALAFQFGSLPPSPLVAPIQVAGNVVFTTTPTVTVGGTAIAEGTYPLIAYTGSLTGALPGSGMITWSGGSASAGTIVNIGKTICLQVTSSSITPVYWDGGNSAWDFTSKNWLLAGVGADYADGDAVIFDDSGGSSPISVALNTTINPLSVTFNNSAKNYVISGSGSISGSASVSLVGSGTVTLSGANSYNGGTTINGGQLNINNGGTGSASPIGTGTLTINGGAIDNTSGSDVTLQAWIPETWNNNFTYAGSANNFNTGAANVLITGNIAVNVGAEDLVVAGQISDGGSGYQLTKTGNGVLTLPGNNFLGGGFVLASGQVNINNSAAGGQSVFTIDNGTTIDNTSGGPLTLGQSSYIWAGSFNFIGTTNLSLGAANVSIPNGLGNITVNIVSNTLTTVGVVANNNTEVIKTGNGTWALTGATSSSQSLGLVVNAGEVTLGNTGGQAITGGNNVGLTVQSNALVQEENNYQIHSDTKNVPLPVNLSGGVWDLNGWNENVDELSISSGGTLRNSATLLNGSGAASSTSTLDTVSGYTAMLSGTNCQFDVTASDGVLNFDGVLGGSGSLVKIGLGVLNLASNNTYTGNTVISNGTLALPGAGSLANTAGIQLFPNTALDLSGNTNSQTLTLQSGQVLSGFGAVTGMVVSVSGATVAPGSASTIGTLTVGGPGDAGASALGGTTVMKLNAGNQTSDQLSVAGSLTYGGTLVLTNLAGTLAPGKTFTLFQAAGGLNGTFNSIIPSRPGAPGFGLVWNTNNMATTGALSVVAASVPPPAAITNVGYSISGGMVTIKGTNGVPNEPYVLLESTNVALQPLSTWTTVATGNYDANGNFSVSITPSSTPEYFVIWTQ